MSVQYQTTICSRGSLDLMVNFTGIRADNTTDAASLGLQLYVYDRDSQQQVVSMDLDIAEIRALYQHLHGVSLVRDLTTTEAGLFVEARDSAAEIVKQLNAIDGLDGNILKVVLPKIGADKRLQSIIDALSADDLHCLQATIRHAAFRTALAALAELMELEQSGDLLAQAKARLHLQPYAAGQPEKVFQNWLESNLWAVGIEYVRQHPARDIGLATQSDLIMETVDGFIDLIEVKRPNAALLKHDTSHKCDYPSPELSKALGQCFHYLKKMDEYKANLEKEYSVKVFRPRIILLAGRSSDFNDGQSDALRALNSNLNHVRVLTYDQLVTGAGALLKQYEAAQEEEGRV